MYFWITSGEDGTSVTPMTEKELRSRLDEVASGDYGDVTFLDEIPESDKGYWHADEGAVVIVLGKIVVPTPKRVVEAYDLPK